MDFAYLFVQCAGQHLYKASLWGNYGGNEVLFLAFDQFYGAGGIPLLYDQNAGVAGVCGRDGSYRALLVSAGYFV